jgi:tRNA pseudouridine38-40 synthase
MPNYKITIEYDGTGFNGWQRQKNASSVQQAIEEAIFKLSQQKVVLHGAGRTDTGVHATRQIANFIIEKTYPVGVIVNALNFHLKPQKVAIIDAEQMPEQFHARFSAKKRYYRYIIINRLPPLIIDRNRAWHVKEPLNVELMIDAAKSLIGCHDFTSFRALCCQAKSSIKTLEELRIEQHDDIIEFYLSAPSFLHHMVRNIVGTLKLVGNHKWQPSQVKEALAAKDRRSAGPTAPPYGLYLYKVDY